MTFRSGYSFCLWKNQAINIYKYTHYIYERKNSKSRSRIARAGVNHIGLFRKHLLAGAILVCWPEPGTIFRYTILSP